MPSSKNYKRDYVQENKYKSSPDQIHKRVLRNKARADALEAGVVHKGDNKQVDHKTPLSKGGSNAASNLRVVDHSKNESFSRNKKGAMVSQTSSRERGKTRKK
jgi:5-methylcytosine-specific restriction endonuclease McrA